MTYHQELLQNCPPPAGRMFGDKQAGLAARAEQAQVLSNMMRTRRPFCFLRMGDMELVYLLSHQNGRTEDLEYDDGPLSGTQSCGNPGLGTRYAARLWRAYEQADYVDFHEKNWPNEHLVSLLKLNRPPGSYRNPDKETSLLFLTWTEQELKAYCQGRRVGFAGAEARLLELLSKTEAFQEQAKDYWPGGGAVFFHQVRDDGRNLDANLDLIKQDLREFVTTHHLDTLFISLGGGAKIIGFELSRELNICCFDFGAMTRALTYSGCDGNRISRSPHYPFLYRIPFGLYMDVLQQAMPNLAGTELLAKAHGQLLREVIKRQVGWTSGSSEFDFSAEAVSGFRRACKEYQKRYSKLFKSSLPARRERAGFLHFCGTHALTAEGRWFMVKFRFKGYLRRYMRR